MAERLDRGTNGARVQARAGGSSGAEDAFNSRAGAVEFQAGMIASWPAGPRDEAGAEQVIRATVKNVGNLVWTGGAACRPRVRGCSTSLRIHANPVEPWSSGRAAGSRVRPITTDRAPKLPPHAA